jgi:hypothetical protein
MSLEGSNFSCLGKSAPKLVMLCKARVNDCDVRTREYDNHVDQECDGDCGYWMFIPVPSMLSVSKTARKFCCAV